MSEKTRGVGAETTETRRIGSTFVPVDNTDPQPPETDNDQDRAFDEFLSLSDQERSGINVWVYAMPTNERGETINGAKLEWLMTEPIDKYSQDELFRLIQTKWMREGEPFLWVRLMVRRARGAGVMKNMLFKLRALPKETTPARNGGDVPTILEAMSKMLQEQQARQDAFIARLAAPAAQPADPMAMMRGTIELLTPLLAIAAGGGRAAPVDPFAQMKGVADAMRSLNDLRSDLGGGGGEGSDSGMAGILKAMAPMAAPALQLLANMTTKPGNAGAAHVAPIPMQGAPPAAPPPQISQPEPDAMPEIKQRNPTRDELKSLGEKLDKVAQLMGRADTTTCANVLLDDVPEEIDQWLFDQLSATDWLGKLEMVAPAVKGKERFFSDIRDEILRIYQSDTAPPPAA